MTRPPLPRIRLRDNPTPWLVAAAGPVLAVAVAAGIERCRGGR